MGEPNGRPTRAPSGASSGSGAVNAPSRTSVPDAETELRAERDAALAAVERVRAVVKSIRFLAALPPFDEGNTVMNAAADDIVAALDGKEKNDE